MLSKLLAIVLCTASGAAAALAAVPYTLDGTEVRDIRARALQRDYQIFVSLPAGYATSTKRYPVLYVTDANYAFPVARAIAARAGNHGKGIADFILLWFNHYLMRSRERDYAARHGQAASSFNDAMSIT